MQRSIYIVDDGAQHFIIAETPAEAAKIWWEMAVVAAGVESDFDGVEIKTPALDKELTWDDDGKREKTTYGALLLRYGSEESHYVGCSEY